MKYQFSRPSGQSLLFIAVARKSPTGPMKSVGQLSNSPSPVFDFSLTQKKKVVPLMGDLSETKRGENFSNLLKV